MLLAFVLFFLASVLVGRSAAFEAMRKNREKWLKLVVLIAAVIVSLSGVVKVLSAKSSQVVVRSRRASRNKLTIVAGQLQ